MDADSKLKKLKRVVKTVTLSDADKPDGRIVVYEEVNVGEIEKTVEKELGLICGRCFQ